MRKLSQGEDQQDDVEGMTLMMRMCNDEDEEGMMRMRRVYM